MGGARLLDKGQVDLLNDGAGGGHRLDGAQHRRLDPFVERGHVEEVVARHAQAHAGERAVQHGRVRRRG